MPSRTERVSGPASNSSININSTVHFCLPGRSLGAWSRGQDEGLVNPGKEDISCGSPAQAQAARRGRAAPSGVCFALWMMGWGGIFRERQGCANWVAGLVTECLTEVCQRVWRLLSALSVRGQEFLVKGTLNKKQEGDLVVGGRCGACSPVEPPRGISKEGGRSTSVFCPGFYFSLKGLLHFTPVEKEAGFQGEVPH